MAKNTRGNASAREELKVFLRARRAEVAPEAVGITRGSRRLARGLRREEVAAIAGVGLTWYTWLEQGRGINVSIDVLGRIATALRLTESDRAYLLALAGHSLSGVRDYKSETHEALRAALASIQTSPAVIVNPRFDMLATNALANSVFEPESYDGPFAENMFWRAFMDPVRRALYPSWTERITYSLGLLRTNYATRVGDPHFEELLHALRSVSKEFTPMWENCKTVPLAPARTSLHPRRLGLLNVCSTRFMIPENPGFLMLVYVAADSATADIYNREAERLRHCERNHR